MLFIVTSISTQEKDSKALTELSRKDLWRNLDPGIYNSANVFDSLGEAYIVEGNNELAIINYEKALALEPDFTSAIDALKKLKRKH